MKLFYSTTLVMLALLPGAVSAQMKIHPTDDFHALATMRVKGPEMSKLPLYSPATRSAEDPQLSFKATHAQSWDYRELRYGMDAYELFLSNMELDENGMPTSSGQFMCVVLFAPETGAELPPAGVYEFKDEYDATFAFGSNIAYYMDVFPHPENPDEGLVGYKYELNGGTIEIIENDGEFNIIADVTGVMESADSQSQNISVTYAGSLTYVNPNPYEPYIPLEGDVELKNLIPSGNYTEGDYNIVFYNVELDEEGFIIGPGDLMVTEIFVNEASPMNLDDLCGTYTPIDAFSEGGVPGSFCQGTWYNYYGIWLALGTNLTIYKEDMSTLVGLATGGTITISRKDEIFTVIFDLTTPEENHIRGSWTGPLADYISDFTIDNSVEKLDSDLTDRIRSGKGYIDAPENAHIYNLSGVEIGNENLRPGLYFVKHDTNVTKVIVK